MTKFGGCANTEQNGRNELLFTPLYLIIQIDRKQWGQQINFIALPIVNFAH